MPVGQTSLVCVLLLLSCTRASSQGNTGALGAVRLAVSEPTQDGALLHWSIRNNLNVAVYAYSFYLWGPAFRVERAAQHVYIDTTPVAENPACPPNRFPPVLLLVIGPHRTIEGDFVDADFKETEGNTISMRIAVGFDPHSVVRQAKVFERSKCKHSPYDAIVKWGKIIESNRILLQGSKMAVRDP